MQNRVAILGNAERVIAAQFFCVAASAPKQQTGAALTNYEKFRYCADSVMSPNLDLAFSPVLSVSTMIAMPEIRVGSSLNARL
jgi:hypothetical protein